MRGSSISSFCCPHFADEGKTQSYSRTCPRFWVPWWWSQFQTHVYSKGGIFSHICDHTLCSTFSGGNLRTWPRVTVLYRFPSTTTYLQVHWTLVGDEGWGKGIGNWRWDPVSIFDSPLSRFQSKQTCVKAWSSCGHVPRARTHSIFLKWLPIQRSPPCPG